jgi:hypothetical protein
MAHRPVTIGHPSKMVDASNWKAVAVGQTGGEVVRDGEFVRVPMVIMDQDAIQRVMSGERELSVGYTCDLDVVSGTSPSGEAYDAIQTNIRGNHLAIVKAGRAGPQARIGDGAYSWDFDPNNSKGSDMPEGTKTRIVVIDGLQVETTDAGALAIEKLQRDIATRDAQLQTSAAAHVKAMETKDAELAKKDAELDTLRGKVLSDADLDKRVAARAALITTARSIVADLKTDGLGDAAIRHAVVKAKVGDAAVAGKSDAYLDARFDMLVEDASKQPDTFRRAVGDSSGLATTVVDRDSFYADRDKQLQNAWKGEPAGKA